MQAIKAKRQVSPYKEHLELQKEDEAFKIPFPPPLQPPPKPRPDLTSNLGISLTSQYAFVLLHLKKSPLSKNLLGVNIPEVCFFSKGLPLELLYSEGGEIRSLKGKEAVRLSEIYSFFKSRGQKRSTSREEFSLACFEDGDCLMLSDTDLFIYCRKFKNDPFFTKLQYLRNKIGSAGDPLESVYCAESDFVFAGEAMDGLMGRDSQDRLAKGEAYYLRYLNAKVAMYLNFQNNIRLSSAHFFYSKGADGQYYLVNATKLVFENLTFAIRKREQRLKVKEEQRNKILVMTPEKELRYRPYEDTQKAKELEMTMNSQWEVLAAKVRIKTNQERIRQEQKNEEAFRLLFPGVKASLDKIVTRSNFRQVRKTMLGLGRRKSLVSPNRHNIKYCSPVQHRRICTESTALSY